MCRGILGELFLSLQWHYSSVACADFTLFFGAVLGWFPVIALDMFLIRTLFPTPVRARRTDDQKDLILKLKP
jgi:hypothetical protein